jgi:protein-tyrosine phosphatase
VSFESIVNFRDLGGLPTVSGGAVRRGLIFRSGTLHRTSANDAARLTSMKIGTVLDLRTDEELARWSAHGAWTPPRVERAPLLRHTWSRDDSRLMTDGAAYLADRYIEMLTGSADVVAAAVRLLAETVPESGVVFHCSAGKDRTGVLSAVLLGLIGVDDATIADDYHATAAEMGALRALFDDADSTPMVDQPAAFLTAPREAMTRALTFVRNEWGDFSRYAASIGIDADTVAALQRTMRTEITSVD